MVGTLVRSFDGEFTPRHDTQVERLHRVLIVEDNPGDARLVQALLEDFTQVPISTDWAPTFDAALDAFRTQTFDAVLLDLNLPDSYGFDTIKRAREATDCAIVVLTGLSDDALGVEAVKEGCQDYLVKGQGDGALLGRTILYAIERKRVESALKQSRERQQLLATVFTISGEAMMVTDANHTIVEVNPAFSALTGYSAQEALGRSPNFLSAKRQGEADYIDYWRNVDENGHWRGEIWARRKNGEAYVQRAVLSVLHHESLGVTHYVAAFTDATDEVRQAQETMRRATYDALTNLPNRLLLMDRIQHALEQTTRTDQGLAVAFLDLDGFKPVNDAYGHPAGDQVLQDVAQRLRQAVREDDTVARLGGDEFVLVMRVANGVEDALLICEKVRESLAQPYFLRCEQEETEVEVGCSIGVALSPDHALKADALIDLADKAMYHSKKTGKGRISLYKDSF